MKQTKKFISACQKAIEKGVFKRGTPIESQDWLYQKLMDAGVMWDSKIGKWVEFNREPANAPTPVIRVRVWGATGENLDEAVRTVKGAFGNGFEMVNQSLPYVCRPPQQLESRVYLEFRRIQEMTQDELWRENDPTAIELEGI